MDDHHTTPRGSLLSLFGIRSLGSGGKTENTEISVETIPKTPRKKKGSKSTTQLSQLLLAEDEAWAALICITNVDNSQEVTSSLVRIFAAEGRAFELAKHCIKLEVEQTKEVALLLRGSNSFSACIAHACLVHGRTFLQRTLAPLIESLMDKTCSQTALSFEVESRRVIDPAQLRQNMENLLHAANQFPSSLLLCLMLVFSTLRSIYEYTQRAIDHKFPNSGVRFATSLFFLRLLCPALVSPEEHGLSKNKPSTNAMRALVLLAKLLQSVANETSASFGTDDSITPLHSWVKSAIPKVQTFFLLVLAERDNFANDMELLVDAIPNVSATADNKSLTAFVQRNVQKYRDRLSAVGANSSIAALPAIIG